MTTKPRIIVLATGGTIAGSAADSAKSAVYQAATVPVEALLDAIPALHVFADVEAEQVAQVDSKDMSVAVLRRLVARIAHWRAQPGVDGIVVTHGTDTLEETAMLLHLTQPAGVPIVLTAAMRPATSLSADGPLNLLNAVRVAASPQVRGMGVLVAIDQEIHAARDVAKLYTSKVGAFGSPSAGPLGFVQDQLVRFLRQPPPVPPLYALPAGDWPWVEVVPSYAASRRVVVDALVAQGVKGIVVAATGNGSIHETLHAALLEAVRRGVAVVRSSRTGAGHVTGLPSVAEGPPRAGALAAAADLNPWKARMALMLVLSQAGPMPPSAAELQQVFDSI